MHVMLKFPVGSKLHARTMRIIVAGSCRGVEPEHAH